MSVSFLICVLQQSTLPMPLSASCIRWRVGDVIRDVRCVAVDFRDGVNYVELSNQSESSTPPAVIVSDPNHLRPGTVVSAIITSISSTAAHHGLWVQLCPGITGFIPALESSVDPHVLNDMQSHFMVGSRFSVCVMDKKNSQKVPKAQRLQQDDHDNHTADHDIVELSILLANSEEAKATKPHRGDIVVGCITKKTRPQGPPSLMLNLRGGFVGRCCITELADIEDWANMPIGKSILPSKTTIGGDRDHQRSVSDSDDHDNDEDDGDGDKR